MMDSFLKLLDHDSNCGIIMGNFDGVHLGHQALFSHFLEKCKSQNLISIIITFAPHPVLFFKEDGYRYLIDPTNKKESALNSIGFDHVVTLEFCSKLQELSPAEFIDEFLLKINYLKLIHLGHDFKMGKGKVDSKELLISSTADKNIEIYEEPPFKMDNTPISSSLIRDFLTSDIQKANALLNRNFCLYGSVVGGRGIGKEQLFPTANIEVVKNQIIPSSGVYMTRIYVNNHMYEGVTNIGVNPTIDEGNSLSVEMFIFNFSQDIYGLSVKLEFISKIRSEKKFGSLDELRAHISKDIMLGKKYFRETSKIKMALIGKSITHSKSQEIYEKLLAKSVNYTLIDCNDENDIPTLEILSNSYHAVSITSPYKKYFVDQVKLENPKFDAVNALSFKKEKVVGTNTDYLAVKSIIGEYLNLGIEDIYILGDGVMSRLTQTVLKEFTTDHILLSRKLGNLDTTSLVLEGSRNNTLVINTCSRDYSFSKPATGSYLFWDMNYNLEHHRQLFEDFPSQYTDGYELLELQGKFALSFWNI